MKNTHILPKSIYRENRILNGTLISTNSSKGSKKPSQYFSELLKQHGKDKLIKILESHLIPAEALPDLLNDKPIFDLRHSIKASKLLCVSGDFTAVVLTRGLTSFFSAKLLTVSFKTFSMAP